MSVNPILHTNRKIENKRMSGKELMDKFGFEDLFFAPTKNYFENKELLDVEIYKNCIKHHFSADYGTKHHPPHNYQHSDELEYVLSDTQETIRSVIEEFKNKIKGRKIKGFLEKKEAKEDNVRKINLLDNILEEMDKKGSDFFNIKNSENDHYIVPQFEYENDEIIYEVRMNHMIDIRDGKPLFEISECKLNAIMLHHEHNKFRYEILYIDPETHYVKHNLKIKEYNGEYYLESGSQYTEIFDHREDAEEFIRKQLHNMLITAA